MEWGGTTFRISWSMVRLLALGGLIGLILGGVGAWVDSQDHPEHDHQRAAIADNF